MQKTKKFVNLYFFILLVKAIKVLKKSVKAAGHQPHSHPSKTFGKFNKIQKKKKS